MKPSAIGRTRDDMLPNEMFIPAFFIHRFLNPYKTAMLLRCKCNEISAIPSEFRWKMWIHEERINNMLQETNISPRFLSVCLWIW